MINGVASWLFNLMLWGAIVTLAVLIYETLNRGFLADQLNSMHSLIGLGWLPVVSFASAKVLACRDVSPAWDRASHTEPNPESP